MSGSCMKFDESVHGDLKAIRAPELNGYTESGWDLVATIPDTTEVQVEIVAKDTYGHDCVEYQKQYHEISWFLMRKSEDSVVAKLNEKLSDTRSDLRSERYEKKELEKKVERLEKSLSENKILMEEINTARDRALKRASVSETRERDTENSYNNLLKLLRSVIGDEEVNNAVLAAVTGGGLDTAKQLITDFIRLRERLGLKIADE